MNFNQFELMDMINILSYAAQVTNIQNDEKWTKYIKNRLDVVEYKVDEILKTLKGENYGTY